MDETADTKDLGGTVSRAASPGVELLISVLVDLAREIEQARVHVENLFSEAEKSSFENGSGTSRNAIVQYFRNIDFIDTMVKPYLTAFDKLNVQSRDQIDELCKRYGILESKLTIPVLVGQ